MASKFLLLVSCLLVSSHAAVVTRASSTNEVLSNQVLSVTGNGHIDVPTSEAHVEASVSKTVKCGSDANKCTGAPAQTEVTAAFNKLLSYLDDQDGISKLQTNQVQLMPQYNYDKNPPQLTGFTAVAGVSFNVKNDNAGDVIDGLVKEGATNIDSVSFVATDAAIEKATNEALKLAVKDGENQAKAVLEAINAEKDGVVSVQIGQASTPQPTPMFSLASNDASTQESLRIEPGTQSVDASVTLHISYS